jgi:hypothetical protein
MVGIKQETKVTSRRRGEDWGGGEKEGRSGILESWTGVPISMNSVLDEFSLRWVKREKVWKTSSQRF